MAKADLKKVQTSESDWKRRVGEKIERCFELAGLTDKEAAGMLDKKQSQISAWLSGVERPHIDAIFAVEELRVPLVLALSELAEPDGVQIEWQIRGSLRRAK